LYDAVDHQRMALLLAELILTASVGGFKCYKFVPELEVMN